MSGEHDDLFQLVFGRPADAAPVLRAILPPELARAIDWSSLAREPGSFVDDSFKHRRSDLLFSARLHGRRVLLYVLFEHQSTAPPLMTFRMLAYMVRIKERFLADNPNAKKVPAVLPVVLYNGSSPWNAPTHFHEVVDLPDTQLEQTHDLIPGFRIIVHDLSTMSDAAIRAASLTATATAALVMLQRARSLTDLAQGLNDWYDVFCEVADAPSNLHALRALMEYAFRVSEAPPDNIQQFARALGPAAQEAYMTAAQQLTEQVRVESEARGQTQGKADLLLRQLTRHFGDCPAEVVERIRAASSAELDAWGERVISAKSLEDVFEA